MNDFPNMLLELVKAIGDEFLYILPYLVIGVLFEAIIRTMKWHVKIRKALTRFGILAIPAATLLGVASPLCACATLPLVISLLVAGLPLARDLAVDESGLFFHALGDVECQLGVGGPCLCCPAWSFCRLYDTSAQEKRFCRGRYLS